MTVIEPNLARYFQVGGIGFALFERGPSSSGWSKNLSLNTTEWSMVRASLDADLMLAELSAKVPEMPKSLISSNMVLECDFCAKIYATSTSQTTLQPNSTDSPPVPLPGGCAKPSSPNDESAGGASSEPNGRKKDAAKRAESERGEEEASSSSSKCRRGERRERGPAAAENTARVDAAIAARQLSSSSHPVPLKTEMVALFELGVGQVCSPYYKLIQLEVRLQAYRVRRFFFRRSIHSVDVCGLVLNKSVVGKIQTLFTDRTAPALCQTMYNEGRLLLLCTETVGQLAHKSYAGLEQLEQRMTALEQTVKSQFNGMKTQFDGMKTEFDGMKTEFDGMKTEFGAKLSNLEKLMLSLSSRPSSKAQSAGAKADPSHPPFAACSAGPASNQKHATKVEAPSKACSECRKTRVLSERCSEDGLRYCSECWDRYDTYSPPPEQKQLSKAARHR